MRGVAASVLPHDGPFSGEFADLLERVLDRSVVLAGDGAAGPLGGGDGAAERFSSRSPNERTAPA
ncbi:hypothetical protein [Streptomyces sp. NK08203]|uniref:hypothetical protein n=1 Tax=Streptomyces sp. NK08203 TaxID=2821730 RepID=UPI001C2DEA23|nr:hypothetical protein [Streptomyces sp. NK08203]